MLSPNIHEDNSRTWGRHPTQSFWATLKRFSRSAGPSSEFRDIILEIFTLPQTKKPAHENEWSRSFAGEGERTKKNNFYILFLPRCSFGEVVFSNSCDKKKGSSLLHPDIPLVSYLVTPPGVVSFRQQQYTSTAPSAKLPWSVTKVTKVNMREPKKLPSFTLTAQMVLLIEDILHQLIGGLSNCIYPQGFIHPWWCRISSINSIILTMPSLKLNVSKKGMNFLQRPSRVIAGDETNNLGSNDNEMLGLS